MGGSQYYNGGWIPCEDQMPEGGEPVLLTVKTGAWISDYGNERVPDNEKTYHPAETATTIGYLIGAHWIAVDRDCFGSADIIDIAAEIGYDPGMIYEVVTAWRPLPEPYKGGSK